MFQIIFKMSSWVFEALSSMFFSVLNITLLLNFPPYKKDNYQDSDLVSPQ